MKKIAVVGGGQIFETVHLNAIKMANNIELVAICELNEKRANDLKKLLPEVKVYTNLELMLEKEVITDAIVAVPNKFHADISIKLLNQKINVFCEKPPATSAKDAKKMLDTALNNKVNLFYNFHLRQLNFLDSLNIESDEIYYIDIVALRNRGIPGWGNFIDINLQGGGALLDLGIHYLDLVLSCTNQYDFENIVGVMSDYIGKNEKTGNFGDWDPKKFTVENFFVGTLKASNYMVNLKTSFAHNMLEKEIYQVSIHHNKGYIDLLKGKSYDVNNNEISLQKENEFDQNELRINSCIEFLNGTNKNLCDGIQGYKIQYIVEELYKNAKGEK